MEGSSLRGFFQLKVMVLPVMDSITGVPSGGSGRISENDDNQGIYTLCITEYKYLLWGSEHLFLHSYPWIDF